MEKLIYPFSKVVWILLIFSAVIAFCVVFIMKRRSRIAREIFFGMKLKDVSRVPHYMNFVSISLGDTSTRLPIYNFGRFVLSLFLLVTIVLRSAYQGVFFNVMTKNVKFNEVKSIKEIYDSNFTVYTTPWYTDIIENHELLGKLKMKIIRAADEKNLIYDAITNEKFNGALMEDYEGAMQISRENETLENLKICKEKVQAMYVVNYARRDFYLLKEINLVIRRLVEGGITNFWIKSLINNHKTNMEKEKNQPKVLNMKHVEGCFKLYLYGIIASLFAFLIELFSRKIFENKTVVTSAMTS